MYVCVCVFVAKLFVAFNQLRNVLKIDCCAAVAGDGGAGALARPGTKNQGSEH